MFCSMVSRVREFLVMAGLTPGSGKDTRLAVRELMELPPSRELELPSSSDGGPAARLVAKLGISSGGFEGVSARF